MLFLPVIAGALLLTAAPAPADHTLDADGVTIRWVEAGDPAGEPVLLVHGFWDSIEFTWQSTGVLDALAPDHRVLALDCRGHGASDKPHDPALYGDEMVEDLARVLDDAGVASAHIVGHSMGAHLTLRFAASHPERVRSITLIGAGGAAPGGDPALMPQVADALARERTLRPLIEFIWPAGAPAPTEDEIAAIDAEAFATNDPLALAAVARAYGALTVTDVEAGVISAPAQAVVGLDDPMRADVVRLKGALPSIQVVEIEGADHIDIIARPELLDAIRAHVRAASTPKPANKKRDPRC